jgi:hypothetical protein
MEPIMKTVMADDRTGQRMGANLLVANRQRGSVIGAPRNGARLPATAQKTGHNAHNEQDESDDKHPPQCFHEQTDSTQEQRQNEQHDYDPHSDLPSSLVSPFFSSSHIDPGVGRLMRAAISQ